MNKSQDLIGIARLAQLTLDHRLGQLRLAAEALDRSKLQLQAINAAAEPADLPLVTAQSVGLTYQRWADARRADLNLAIARQNATWITARDDARIAFGRSQVLRRLIEKQTRER